MLTKFRLLFAATLLVIMSAAAAFAQNIPELNLSSNGLALRGIDPVSYIAQGEPVKGDPAISAQHKGGTYHFTSEASRSTFLKEPAKYLPAYGGYCAYGTAVGAKVDGDPYRWNIVDGQLYLNISRSVDLLWKTNKSGFITKADKNWPGLKHQ